MTVHVVVGGQYGSEAKGHVTAQLVRRSLQNTRTTVVRIGGPNAGHSVVDANGQTWAFRQVPVGAVIPGADLVIGAGSEVELSVLLDEIERLEAAGFTDVRRRLMIDSQATVLTQTDHEVEETRQMQARIGSTSKGIGAARAGRIMRTAPLVGQMADAWAPYDLRTCDTTTRLQVREGSAHHNTIIEGTQGYGLGLHAGHYPYCTSGDCRAVDFVAQAGLGQNMWAPWVVFRTFPIRVAGNSGPMEDETSWEALGEETGGYIQPERTTVTKKIRRVGRWDHGLANDALNANGFSSMPVLTFVDYLDPSLANSTSGEALRSSVAWDWIEQREAELQTRFGLFTTGPDSCIWRHEIDHPHAIGHPASAVRL